MAGESVHRLFSPLSIHFNEAIGIAALGLAVNLVCAFLLKDDPHHHGGHDHHAHGVQGHHHDLNQRAAYVHVLADAFTSVLAITALTSGKFFGWSWLDPVVGIVGSGVVFSWAYSLLRDTGTVLLDVIPESSDLPAEIRRAVESDGDFNRNRSAHLAGQQRQVRGDCFDRRAGAQELRGLSRAANRARRTSARHSRNAAVPRSRIARRVVNHSGAEQAWIAVSVMRPSAASIRAGYRESGPQQALPTQARRIS